MSIETGVLIDKDGRPIHWHLPLGRNVAYLPDSPDLWSVIWENRASISGFAHSHPGWGNPHPSLEDVTTFNAIERALGIRLRWWIITSNMVAEYTWSGPGKLDYIGVICPYDSKALPWLDQLHNLSYEEDIQDG